MKNKLETDEMTYNLCDLIKEADKSTEKRTYFGKSDENCVKKRIEGAPCAVNEDFFVILHGIIKKNKNAHARNTRSH